MVPIAHYLLPNIWIVSSWISHYIPMEYLIISHQLTIFVGETPLNPMITS